MGPGHPGLTPAAPQESSRDASLFSLLILEPEGAESLVNNGARPPASHPKLLTSQRDSSLRKLPKIISGANTHWILAV